jgi:hypothetical protein
MGYKTASAERSQASSAVSSAIAAFNNPDGSGFALTSTALTADKELKQYTVVPGTDPINSATSVGGAIITAVVVTDSNYAVLDDTAVATTGGYIKLTGSGFKTGCVVYVAGTAASTTTFVSYTEVRAAVGANSSNTHAIYLLNTDGSAAFYLSGLVVSGVPTWSTNATLTAAFEQVAYTQALTATGDATISYSLKAGSNLPAGVSLNSSTGALTGTTPADTGSTTYTFTIIATDGQNQDTERLFSLTINTDAVTWSSPAAGTSYELPVNTIMSNVALQATSASGRAVTYAANTLPTGVTLSGNVISGTATVVGQTVSTLLTANNSIRSATRVVNWTVQFFDPYFKNTTLLLNGNDGINGAQNNTFLDSSTNNFTITRNGNTTQGTFTPFSPTGWSVFTSAASATTGLRGTVSLVNATTTTFTAECWVYMTEAPVSGDGIPCLIGMDALFNSSIYLSFGPNASRQLVLRWFDGASKTATGGTALALNTWYHIAVVSNANALAMYVNGVAETLSGTTTLTNRNSTTNTFSLFLNSSATNYQFRGYASSIRVCTSAVYTGAFTPSTTPLTTTSQGATNCKLLTAQNNRFVDTSSNAYALTVQGAPSVQAFSPFAPTTEYSAATHGGSGYFDGTGDYLVTSGSALDTGAGTSDVTFECWVYNNGFSGSQYGRGICAFYPSASYASTRLLIRLSSSTNLLNCYLVVGGTIQFGTSGTNSTASITPNAWTHVAIVRSSQTFYIYINGVRDTTLAATSASLNTFDKFDIGRTQDGNVPEFNGLISNFRYLKGTAQYTGTTYTIPTAPFTPVNNTQLLLNFTNAGIYDATAKNDLETVGNAQVNTSIKKYGTGSIYFDGTGDNLQIPSSPTFAMGGGDWTVEMWLYPNNVSSLQALLSFGSGTWRFFLNSSGLWFLNSAASIVQTSQSIISTGQWYHVAVCKNGSSVRIFLNGTQVGGTGTDTNNYASAIAYIGSEVAGSYLNGYIDDLRVTKGVARYTANFTAPTASFGTK